MLYQKLCHSDYLNESHEVELSFFLIAEAISFLNLRNMLVIFLVHHFTLTTAMLHDRFMRVAGQMFYPTVWLQLSTKSCMLIAC